MSNIFDDPAFAMMDPSSIDGGLSSYQSFSALDLAALESFSFEEELLKATTSNSTQRPSFRNDSLHTLDVSLLGLSTNFASSGSSDYSSGMSEKDLSFGGGGFSSPSSSQNSPPAVPQLFVGSSKSTGNNSNLKARVVSCGMDGSYNPFGENDLFSEDFTHTLSNKASFESFASCSTVASEHVYTPRASMGSWTWDDNSTPASAAQPTIMQRVGSQNGVNGGMSPSGKRDRAALQMKTSMPSLTEETADPNMIVSFGMNTQQQSSNNNNMMSMVSTPLNTKVQTSLYQQEEMVMPSADNGFNVNGQDAELQQWAFNVDSSLDNSPANGAIVTGLLPPAEIPEHGNVQSWSQAIPTFPSQVAFEDASINYHSDAVNGTYNWVTPAPSMQQQLSQQQMQQQPPMIQMEGVGAGQMMFMGNDGLDGGEAYLNMEYAGEEEEQRPLTAPDQASGLLMAPMSQGMSRKAKSSDCFGLGFGANPQTPRKTSNAIPPKGLFTFHPHSPVQAQTQSPRKRGRGAPSGDLFAFSPYNERQALQQNVVPQLSVQIPQMEQQTTYAVAGPSSAPYQMMGQQMPQQQQQRAPRPMPSVLAPAVPEYSQVVYQQAPQPVIPSVLQRHPSSNGMQRQASTGMMRQASTTMMRQVSSSIPSSMAPQMLYKNDTQQMEPSVFQTPVRNTSQYQDRNIYTSATDVSEQMYEYDAGFPQQQQQRLGYGTPTRPSGRGYNMRTASVMQPAPSPSPVGPVAGSSGGINGWAGGDLQQVEQDIYGVAPDQEAPAAGVPVFTSRPLATQEQQMGYPVQNGRPMAPLPTHKRRASSKSVTNLANPKPRTPSKSRRAPQAAAFSSFINFTADDADKLLTGVAPSGSQKRRREPSGSSDAGSDLSRTKRAKSDATE